MWLPRVNFRTGRGVQEDLWGDTSISPARAGTNILEYGRLSELSKDLTYLRNVQPPGIAPLYASSHPPLYLMSLLFGGSRLLPLTDFAFTWLVVVLVDE